MFQDQDEYYDLYGNFEYETENHKNLGDSEPTKVNRVSVICLFAFISSNERKGCAACVCVCMLVTECWSQYVSEVDVNPS